MPTADNRLLSYQIRPMTGKRTIRSKVISHAAGWLVLIAYELLSFYIAAGSLGPITFYLVYYALNITLFYTHFRVLDRVADGSVPGLIKTVGLTLLEAAGFLLLKVLTDSLLKPSGPSFAELILSLPALTLNLFRTLYFIGLSTLFWLGGRNAQFRRRILESRLKELEAASEKAEIEARLGDIHNAYLRQQINPHLLFNTLSFIYSTVYRSSAEGARCVLLLSDLMRYSLEEPDPQGKVPLNAEIAQIENLISINRLRYDAPLNITLQVSGNTSAIKILPLVLLTLSENIFKHADLREEPASISISLSPDGTLLYVSSNAVDPAALAPRSGGLGLRNLRTRLEYTYRGQFTLDSERLGDIYQCTLTIMT